MKVLTPVRGYTRIDSVINDEIRRELEVCSVKDEMNEFRAQRLENMQRMVDTRIQKQTFHHTPKGRGRTRDSRYTCEDQE
jgi:hypothetical protein